MYSCLNRSLHRSYLKVISSEVPKQFRHTFYEKAIITFDDTLDEFTSQLTQKKAHKWSTRKATLRPLNDFLPTSSIATCNQDHDFKNYSEEKINLLFHECVQIGGYSDIFNLMKQCIEHRKCPSLSNGIYTLTLCAQNGDKDTIILITDLYEEFYPDIVKANSYFRNYLAEAIWVKGNISEALKIFKAVYSENTFLRRRIRLVFKYLVQDIVSTRSEAALINIAKFAEEILIIYKDFFPLACVWQTCFLSEWFTDQTLALKLLESNDGLCKAVVSRIPYVVSISLNSHRTEVVYRLLELLLKYEMKMQYGGVLSALLDYQISQGDIRTSAEIIRWSLNNNIELTAYQNEKFLNLLLNKTNVDDSNLLKEIGKVKKEKVNRDLRF